MGGWVGIEEIGSCLAFLTSPLDCGAFRTRDCGVDTCFPIHHESTQSTAFRQTHWSFNGTGGTHDIDLLKKGLLRIGVRLGVREGGVSRSGPARNHRRKNLASKWLPPIVSSTSSQNLVLYQFAINVLYD